MKREIKSLRAPRPVGPYSQAIQVGNLVFISGQLPIDPDTGDLVREPFARAVEIVLRNISEILREVGGDLSNIVKITVYTTDLGRFNEFNEVYKKFFREPYPARSVVEVKRLPRDSPIEIEAIAYV
ncbi:MAG: RidA family protein [Sulfolobales archaeon]